MSPSSHDHRDERLFALGEELERRLAAGESLDAPALARAFGVELDEARRAVAALELLAAEPESSAGEPAAEPPRPVLPEQFELLEELGRGGMGIVYRARQRALQREVAIKVLMPGELAFGQALRRFRREARSLARLRHRHIVSIHEVGECEGHLYFSMDLIEGGTLATALAEGPLTVARSVRLLRQVASAVAYVHERGIVHRDLKPQNVLLDAAGDAYVVDFGLARDEGLGGALDSRLTATGHWLGTPAYMAPEQARGEHTRVGEASDIYAMGVMLYECLCGRAPFAGRPLVDMVHAIIHEDPRPLRSLDPRIPFALEWVAAKAMAKEPSERYPTAQALLEDLERFAEGRMVRAEPPRLSSHLKRWLRRERRPLGASAVTLLLALFLFQFFFEPERGPSRSQWLETAGELEAQGSSRAAALVLSRLAGEGEALEDEAYLQLVSARFAQALGGRGASEPGGQEPSQEPSLEPGQAASQAASQEGGPGAIAEECLAGLALRIEALRERTSGSPRTRAGREASLAPLAALVRAEGLQALWQRQMGADSRASLAASARDLARARPLGLEAELSDGLLDWIARKLEATAAPLASRYAMLLADLLERDDARPALLSALARRPALLAPFVFSLLAAAPREATPVDAPAWQRGDGEGDFPWSELLSHLDADAARALVELAARSADALSLELACALLEVPWTRRLESVEPALVRAELSRLAPLDERERYRRRLEFVIGQLLPALGLPSASLERWLSQRVGSAQPGRDARDWSRWLSQGGAQLDWSAQLARELGCAEALAARDSQSLLRAFHASRGSERRRFHALLRLACASPSSPRWPDNGELREEPRELANRWQRELGSFLPEAVRVRVGTLYWEGLDGPIELRGSSLVRPDANGRFEYRYVHRLARPLREGGDTRVRSIQGQPIGQRVLEEVELVFDGQLDWRAGGLALSMTGRWPLSSAFSARYGLEDGVGTLAETVGIARLRERAGAGAAIDAPGSLLFVARLELEREGQSAWSLDQWVESLRACLERRRARASREAQTSSGARAGAQGDAWERSLRQNQLWLALQPPFVRVFGAIGPLEGLERGASALARLSRLAAGELGVALVDPEPPLNGAIDAADWAWFALHGRTRELRWKALEPLQAEPEAEVIARCYVDAGLDAPDWLGSHIQRVESRRTRVRRLWTVGIVFGAFLALSVVFGVADWRRKRRRRGAQASAGRGRSSAWPERREFRWENFVGEPALFALFMTLYVTGWGGSKGWGGPWLTPTLVGLEALFAFRAAQGGGGPLRWLSWPLYLLAAVLGFGWTSGVLGLATLAYDLAVLSTVLLFPRLTLALRRPWNYLGSLWLVLVLCSGLVSVLLTMAALVDAGVDIAFLGQPVVRALGGLEHSGWVRVPNSQLLMQFYLYWLFSNRPTMVFRPSTSPAAARAAA